MSATQAKGVANGAPMLLLPALNEMIDITTTRTPATEMRPPVVIFSMLAVLANASASRVKCRAARSTRRPSIPHKRSDDARSA